MPFSVSVVSFEIFTWVTLLVWSLMQKKNGTSTLHASFFILFLSLPTADSTRTLKRQMESSRSQLDSW